MREEGDTARDNLEQAKSELAASKTAIAKLKLELEEKDRQLSEISHQSSVNSQPEIVEPEIVDPQPEEPETETESNTGIPVIDPEPIPQTEAQGTTIAPEIAPGEPVKRKKLLEHILKKYPKAEVNEQMITDATSGNSKRLPELEQKYGFKHIGKIGREHAFIIT